MLSRVIHSFRSGHWFHLSDTTVKQLRKNCKTVTVLMGQGQLWNISLCLRPVMKDAGNARSPGISDQVWHEQCVMKNRPVQDADRT